MNLRHIAPLAVAASLVACAGEVRDPEADVASTEPARELSALKAAPYAIVRMDGKVALVARLGAATTVCADGVTRTACEVAEIDLSRADMSEQDETFARARLADGRALVIGKLARERLVASEVWVRRASSPALEAARTPTATPFVLRDVRGACAEGAPCAWLRAEPLDGSRALYHDGLDTSVLGDALGAAEEGALARGRVMAHGASLGSRFVAVSLYLPFPEVAIAAPIGPR